MISRLRYGIQPKRTVVTLTAWTNLGSQFSGWSGDVLTDTPVITLSMDSDHVLYTDFLNPPGEIAIEGPGSGYLTTGTVFTAITQITATIPLTYVWSTSSGMTFNTVSLSVSGDGGADIVTRLGYITVYTPFSAGFSASTTGGVIPLTVEFSDSSTGSITTWFWDFGEGEASSLQSPSHTYTTTSTFTVRLTVNGPGGVDEEEKTSALTQGSQGRSPKGKVIVPES